MARHCFLLALGLAALLSLEVLKAQDSPLPETVPVDAPESGPSDSRGRSPRPQDRRTRDGAMDKMRQRLDKMPPEQRQKAMEKFKKWQQMSPDEQAHFRFIDAERKKRVKKAIDDAIAASGLKLDDSQREKFAEVYKNERHKLEEELRAEMDKRRQERMPAFQNSVVEAYKNAVAAATPSPAPATSSPSQSATP